jgi:hypothetical protein
MWLGLSDAKAATCKYDNIAGDGNAAAIFQGIEQISLVWDYRALSE